MDVMTSSVLGILSLKRAEGRIPKRSVSYVPMVTATRIWYQIGASTMLALKIQKLLHPLQLLLRPHVSPIQARRAGPSQSRHKAEAVSGAPKRPSSYCWSSWPLSSYYIPSGVCMYGERSQRNLLKSSIWMDPVWHLQLNLCSRACKTYWL